MGVDRYTPIRYNLARLTNYVEGVMIKEGGDYERIQLVIPKDLRQKVDSARQKERRNRSNMIAVLIDEALAARAKTVKQAENEPGNFMPALPVQPVGRRPRAVGVVGQHRVYGPRGERVHR